MAHDLFVWVLVVMAIIGIVMQVVYIVKGIRHGTTKEGAWETMLWTGYSWVVITVYYLAIGYLWWALYSVIALVVFGIIDYSNYKRF